MAAYVIRRLLLMLPTLFGIILLNFLIIQIAPGGPVEQMIAKLQGIDVAATERFSGGGSDTGAATQSMQQQLMSSSGSGKYRGAQGLERVFIHDQAVMRLHAVQVTPLLLALLRFFKVA